MDLLTTPLFLMSLSILAGLLLGQITIRRFRFGVSGALFAGMALSSLVHNLAVRPYLEAYSSDPESVPAHVARLISDGLVDKAYFNLLLVLFVASVGLQAAPNVVKVFRGHGTRFLFLTMVITSAGCGMAYLLFRLIPGLNQMALTGVYTGALTSSPGLGVALETAAKQFVDPSGAAASAAQASVGLGYAAAYPFSVVAMILFMPLLPRLFKIDMDRERELLRQELGSEVDGEQKGTPVGGLGIDFPAFMLVCVAGMVIGRISLPLGSVGKVSLETTGGVLVAALLLGSRGSLGPFNFRMQDRALGVIKQLSVVYFMAYVGLNYGHQAINAILGPNALLALVGLATTGTALLVGFLFGRHVLRMNWILLAGGICGSMTSTPGLSAAMEATGCQETAGGYGSAYPIGLLCKVILVLLLFKLPL
ncbi:MAG: hypothetical protein ACOX2K_00825 [Bacillota bacterium]